jgi:hypothetical protein
MNGLKLVDELIKEASRIDMTRRKMKELGFSENDINDMVNHFVIDKITKPMED